MGGADSSVAGDQLARVALTLLVYDRTRSPLLAAVTFVASVVPEFLGGLLLAGLADRWPRRDLMIACDITRAVLVTVMVLPAVPIAGLVGLLFAVTLLGAPFNAARAALYPDILTGDTYVLGTALTFTTAQAAQVAGFGLGGVAVGIFGIHSSLVADALTFLLSATLTVLGVAPGSGRSARQRVQRVFAGWPQTGFRGRRAAHADAAGVAGCVHGRV